MLRTEGLFRVALGLCQVRNFDNNNLSFIQSPRGGMAIDTLIVEEVAKAACDLVKRHVADKPVLAVIYTHDDTDHFPCATGFTNPRHVEARSMHVIAPLGFVDEVLSA